jgi:hypothetical protein
MYPCLPLFGSVDDETTSTLIRDSKGFGARAGMKKDSGNRPKRSTKACICQPTLSLEQRAQRAVRPSWHFSVRIFTHPTVL